MSKRKRTLHEVPRGASYYKDFFGFKLNSYHFEDTNSVEYRFIKDPTETTEIGNAIAAGNWGCIGYFNEAPPELQLLAVEQAEAALRHIEDPTDAAKALHRILWGSDPSHTQPRIRRSVPQKD